jgi:hypothetical protein
MLKFEMKMMSESLIVKPKMILRSGTLGLMLMSSLWAESDHATDQGQWLGKQEARSQLGYDRVFDTGDNDGQQKSIFHVSHDKVKQEMKQETSSHAGHDHGSHAGHDHGKNENDHKGHDHGSPKVETQSQAKIIDLPALSRQNLGINFAKVQRRSVAKTITLPGTFELLPSAQQHYPLPVAGRVEVMVEPLDKVQRGELLLMLDSPDWRALQLQLTEAKGLILQADVQRQQALSAQLAVSGLGSSENQPDVYSAQVKSSDAELATAKERLAQWLARAATLTGYTVAALSQKEKGKAFWQTLQGIPLRAVTDGVVREVDAASGTWVSAGTEVVHVVSPNHLRLRARALQSDLIDHLRDGQMASVVPPEGRGKVRRAEGILGNVRLGVTGDPKSRTVDVYVDLPTHGLPPWVRPQVTAMVDVMVDGDLKHQVLAIPNKALIRDGLDLVFFRRIPEFPDVVIRTLAVTGVKNARWTEIRTELKENDEVVMDGIYQLKLSSTGQKMKAGHMHPDGTFHDGDH